mmetsp:Transcript_5069/g.8644  ORF Transcript_5069/g.8644 Transcript_5069/m.8644 type:complete len:83 (+) Transcript_5069:414-662(+)
MAYMITPNQFEVEQLTGSKITDEESLLKAIEKLHGFGPKIVVVSSTDFGDDSGEFITLYASDRSKEAQSQVVKVTIPIIKKE